MSAERLRAAAARSRQEPDVPEKRVCRAPGSPRSLVGYNWKRADDEAGLRDDILKLSNRRRRQAYRGIAVLPRRDDQKVDHKRVERLWGALVLRATRRRGRLEHYPI